MRVGLSLALSLMLVVALCVGGCATEPVPTPEPDLGSPERFPPDLVALAAVPAQSRYLPGEEVEIEFSFTNNFTESVIISPFPPEITIMLPTCRPADIVRSFTAGTKELELQPGEIVTYDLTWGQQDNSGQQVTPGWYEICVEYAARTSSRQTGATFGTGLNHVLIQFPQGAMEKVIEVNQSQTVIDLPLIWRGEELSIEVTITLERVELSEEGAEFCFFATSADWPRASFEGPEWSFELAEYTVDGVIHHVCGGGIRYLNNGVELSWGYDEGDTNPVPSDAKELTLTITGEDPTTNWEGPWEFHVSLK